MSDRGNPAVAVAHTIRATVERSSMLGAWTIRFEADAVPGTLAVFAGVLAMRRLDIISAMVSRTSEGRVIDTFDVHPLPGEAVGPGDGHVLAQYCADVLVGARDLNGELRRLRAQYPATERSQPVVEVMTDSSMTTGIKVRAADRPGLLYDIASTLTTHHLRTRSLTVLTFGGHAYDTFRVVDTAGGAPDDARLLAAVKSDLERVCRP